MQELTSIFSPAQLRTFKSTLETIGCVVDLAPPDVFGLSVEFARGCLGQLAYTRGKSLNFREVMRCDLEAVRLVAFISPEGAVASGFFPSIHLSGDERWDAVLARLYGWRDPVLSDALIQSVHGNPSARQTAISQVHSTVTAVEFAPGLASMKALRYGRRDLEVEREIRTRSDQTWRKDDAYEDASLVSDYRLINGAEHRVLKGLFIDRKGQIALGKRFVRDALRQVEPNPGIGTKVGTKSLEDEGVQEMDDARSALAAVEAQEIARLAHSLIEELRSESKPGSARSVVLQNYSRLVNGDLLLVDLANQEGFAKSTLSEAKSDIERDLRGRLRG